MCTFGSAGQDFTPEWLEENILMDADGIFCKKCVNVARKLLNNS